MTTADFEIGAWALVVVVKSMTTFDLFANVSTTAISIDRLCPNLLIPIAVKSLSTLVIQFTLIIL